MFSFVSKKLNIFINFALKTPSIVTTAKQIEQIISEIPEGQVLDA